MAKIVTNESRLDKESTSAEIQQALAGLNLGVVPDSPFASRYAVSSVDASNVPTLVGAQTGGNTGTVGPTQPTHVIGNDSINTATSANLVTITLVNDVGSPGNTYYYGTGPTGVRGWHTIASALLESSSVTLTTASDGVTTFSLPVPTGDLSGAWPASEVVSTHLSAPLPVAQGGTAHSSLTAHAVLLGSGTGAIGNAPTGTSGRVLVDQGSGADPAFQALSGDATLAGSGVLTLAASGVVAATYGSATEVAQITVGDDGRVTAASNVPITTGGAVTSVFGRTGAVVANAADYTFSQIGSKPTTIAGYGITDALVTTNNLSDVASSQTAYANLIAQFSNTSVWLSATQNLTNAAFTPIIFDTSITDKLSEYSTTTGKFTATYAGIYMVNAVLYLNAGVGNNQIVSVFVNGAEHTRILQFYAASAGANAIGGSCIVPLSAGDYIQINVYSNEGTPHVGGNKTDNYFRIVRIQ